ncbi:Multidrug resistance-associated protein 1 [Mortierella sp. AD094]|nr:Multidrug resistance-associated protein 1 [Mortierella sp. AD094]
MSLDAFCNDIEGWGPISEKRVDLTLCVESTMLEGLPALVAIITSAVQTYYMWKSGRPLDSGRSNTIYWVSQVLMFSSAIALAVRVVLLRGSNYAPATMFSSTAMAIAWLVALPLNYFQHLQEIRSSNIIFAQYMASLVASTINIRTMVILDQINQAQFKAFVAFFAINTLGFAAEAWPRSSTEDQGKYGINLYNKANLFSRLTFQYLQPLFTAGYEKPLTASDIADMIPEKTKAKNAYDRLNHGWQKQVAEYQTSGTTPNLFLTVLRSHGWSWLSIFTPRILASTLTFVLPQLLNQMLSFIESNQTPFPKPVSLGVILAFGMFFVTILTSIFSAQYNQATIDASVESRTALITMVYRKSLKLSSGSKKKFTTGEITNHMSVDAERFDISFASIPLLISTPYEICIAIWMIYLQISWSVFVGVAVILLVGPINGAISSVFYKLDDAKMKVTDDRVGLTSEVLSSMKVIKLYGWDDSFRERVNQYRRRELSNLRKSGVAYSFMSIMFQAVPLLVSLCSFAVYATYGGPDFGPGDMSPQRVFVSVSLFALLSNPLQNMSHVVQDLIGLKVAANRLQEFLLAEEISETATEMIESLPADPSAPLIEVKDGIFAWGPEGPETETETGKKALKKKHVDEREEDERALNSEELTSEDETEVEQDYSPTLVNINLSVSRGDLTAIVGRVGQGKTSLLSAILGDMYRRHGTVKVYGRLAYVPQQAWIVNATLRENITFGNKFDQVRYDYILMACGLLPDIAMLPAGDQTEIGERGINLSGGQKQRISLARAAYENADVYLLDDPLSAVDAHVDQHLWQHLIGPTGLLKDKTRVLVTHSIHHLEETDQIVMVKDGMIAENGAYNVLMEAKGSLYQLVTDFSVNRGGARKQATNDETTEGNCTGDSVAEDENDGDVPTTKDDNNGELIEDETVEEGSVSWSVYKIYAKAVSYRYCAIVIFLYTLGQTVQIGTNVWLDYWTTVGGTEGHTVGEFLGVYAALVIVFMILSIISCYSAMVIAAQRASISLHERLLERVMRLPMSFFDTTPLGRTINRFSMDIYAVDESAPWHAILFIISLVSIIGSVIIIGVTTPVFLVVLPILAIMYILIQSFYIRTSRQLKRIDAISRSPIYQQFSETLSGVATIRALRAHERFISENGAKTDAAANALYSSLVANRWLQVRLESVGAIVVLGAALAAVFSRNSLNTSSTGLALTYALSSTEMFTGLIRSFCGFENQLVAVERIDEFTRNKTEAPAVTDVKLPENWPQAGHVEFRNYSTRYREGLDLVIKNVSFEVQPTEKIGICGRTGAGKSSLTLALFRIIEAANSHWAKAGDTGSSNDFCSRDVNRTRDLENVTAEESGGSIWIDGVDISTVGLKHLRQNLAIIPQDPILFQGTLRENLDPFGELQDADLWIALERAHLKKHISTLAGGLAFEVSQNGENFSVGQRSLICLARALLRKSKILVLDEATAAVDVETDELIQKTIREEFKDRTILTIAHRIKTIMDADKILVLEKGKVEEFESPRILLKKPDSMFYKLARQAGEI